MPEVSPFLLGHLETQTFPLRRLRVETFRELAKFLKGLGGKKNSPPSWPRFSPQHTRVAVHLCLFPPPRQARTTFPGGPRAASGAARRRSVSGHIFYVSSWEGSYGWGRAPSDGFFRFPATRASQGRCASWGRLLRQPRARHCTRSADLSSRSPSI